MQNVFCMERPCRRQHVSYRNRPVHFKLPHVCPHVENFDGLVCWKFKLSATKMVAKPADVLTTTPHPPTGVNELLEIDKGQPSMRPHGSLTIAVCCGSKVQVTEFLTCTVTPNINTKS